MHPLTGCLGRLRQAPGPGTHGFRIAAFPALLVACIAFYAPTAALTLISGPERLQGKSFPDTLFEDVTYVSHHILDSLFAEPADWIPERQKLMGKDAKGRAWYFTLDNPFVVVDGKAYNLSYPVRRGPEYLYLPALQLAELLNELTEAGIRFDAGTRITSAAVDFKAESGANVDSITVDTRDNGSLVTVHARKKLPYQEFWLPPLYILKLDGGKFHSSIPSQQKLRKGMVKDVMTVQETGLAQVTLNLNSSADTVELLYLEDRQEYLLSVVSKRKQAKTEAPAPKSRELSTIIIDPGHGGKDPGAQAEGLNEADVTLAVGKELKKLLEEKGFNAILTRETDEYLPLDKRPKFASEKGGDLFISLHCNAIDGTPSRKKRVRGFVVYILREGESEEDKALARRENQAAMEQAKKEKTEISPVEWILLEHQLNLYSKESEGFAESIVHAFEPEHKIPKYSTGARQAGFYVLVGAFMPAVLFEMGFITNAQDRAILKSKQGQRFIAERLAKAIENYRKSS